MYSPKAPLHVHARILILTLVISLTGCVTMTPSSYKMTQACGGRDYCPERDGPRQYIRAPDGWGGKYCLQNPTEC